MAYTNEVKAAFLPSNMGAFGDLIAQPLDPVLQLGFEYGLNSQLGTGTVANGGVVDANVSRLRLQSGTASNGSASYASVRSARYRAGQGTIARFTAAFDANAASSTQRVGMGNTANGYFFGYNGTSFGILHRNNSSNTWIPQASWNRDKLNGTGSSGITINPSFLNVYLISYPYLGAGTIRFFVLAKDAQWVHVHDIEYPNTSQSVQLTNPNLRFLAESVNSGNTSNLTIFVGSVGVFRTGLVKFLGLSFAASFRKANISTQTSIVTLRNATTYNGVENRSPLRFHTASVGWDGANDTGLLNIIRNATLGGTPSFAAVSGTTADGGVTITNGESIASIDTAGTTITGGTILFNASFARNSNLLIELHTMDLFLEPGGTMTFAFIGDSAGAVRVAVNWLEDT